MNKNRLGTTALLFRDLAAQIRNKQSLQLCPDLNVQLFPAQRYTEGSRLVHQDPVLIILSVQVMHSVKQNKDLRRLSR